MRRFGTIAVLLLCAAVARADDDLIDADRPGIADGSHSVKKGRFQIEFGYERDDSSADQLRFFPTLLRYGITDSFELRAESGTFEHNDEGSGWDTVSLGFKDHFYDKNNVSLGVIGRWFFPTGSGEFKSSRHYGDVRLAGDMQFGDRWAINPNAGVAIGSSDSSSTTATGALTVQYNLTPKSNVFVDGSVQKSLVIVDTGAAFILGNDSQIDVSLGWGAHGADAPRVFWSAGVSHRF